MTGLVCSWATVAIAQDATLQLPSVGLEVKVPAASAVWEVEARDDGDELVCTACSEASLVLTPSFPKDAPASCAEYVAKLGGKVVSNAPYNAPGWHTESSEEASLNGDEVIHVCASTSRGLLVAKLTSLSFSALAPSRPGQIRELLGGLLSAANAPASTPQPAAPSVPDRPTLTLTATGLTVPAETLGLKWSYLGARNDDFGARFDALTLGGELLVRAQVSEGQACGSARLARWNFEKTIVTSPSYLPAGFDALVAEEISSEDGTLTTVFCADLPGARTLDVLVLTKRPRTVAMVFVDDMMTSMLSAAKALPVPALVDVPTTAAAPSPTSTDSGSYESRSDIEHAVLFAGVRSLEPGPDTASQWAGVAGIEMQWVGGDHVGLAGALDLRGGYGTAKNAHFDAHLALGLGIRLGERGYLAFLAGGGLDGIGGAKDNTAYVLPMAVNYAGQARLRLPLGDKLAFDLAGLVMRRLSGERSVEIETETGTRTESYPTDEALGLSARLGFQGDEQEISLGFEGRQMDDTKLVGANLGIGF